MVVTPSGSMMLTLTVKTMLPCRAMSLSTNVISEQPTSSPASISTSNADGDTLIPSTWRCNRGKHIDSIVSIIMFYFVHNYGTSQMTLHCKKCGVSEHPRGAIFYCFHDNPYCYHGNSKILLPWGVQLHRFFYSVGEMKVTVPIITLKEGVLRIWNGNFILICTVDEMETICQLYLLLVLPSASTISTLTNTSSPDPDITPLRTQYILGGSSSLATTSSGNSITARWHIIMYIHNT